MIIMVKSWQLNLYALLIICGILLLSIFIDRPEDRSREVLSLKLTNKNLGEIVSIIQNGEESMVSAHYPLFGKPLIDSQIKARIYNHMEEFHKEVQNQDETGSKYLPELNIDYEVYGRGHDTVSIKFIITKNFPYYAHPDLSLETITYDLKSENQLYLDDFLRGKYLKRISSFARQHFASNDLYKHHIDNEIFLRGTEANRKNYKNFLLKDDSIVFIFDKYQILPGSFGIVPLEVPYEDLGGLLKFPRISDDYMEVSGTMDKNYIEEIETLANRKLDPTKPMVALTFDDGPSPATESILDTLSQHNSLATFFVLGNRVAKHKNIVKRITNTGNELGNHSYNHKELTILTSDQLNEQIDRTQSAIMEVIGFSPQLLRPTYGSHNEKLRSQINMPIVLWSIDTEDWKSRDSKKISNHVLENVKDGDIVLMHDLYMSTAKAIEIIVPELIKRGFQLVTISELYEASGDSLRFGQVYTDNKARPAASDGE